LGKLNQDLKLRPNEIEKVSDKYHQILSGYENHSPEDYRKFAFQESQRSKDVKISVSELKQYKIDRVKFWGLCILAYAGWIFVPLSVAFLLRS
jgi:hypothetical protein